MRTYTLINNDGETYDITVKDKAFFYNVSGLGYERDIDTQRIEDRYAVLADKLNQVNIDGTIRFFQPGAEQEYFNFAQFCQNAPLTLVYNPGHGSYYRKGRVAKIDRKDGTDTLEIKVSFKPSTPWIKDLNKNNDNIVSGGKVYDYTYDYTYTDTIEGSIVMESDSYLSSPCKLTIYGEVVNPVWRHYVNNQLVATGKVNATIPQNHVLIIDTTSNPYSIKEFDMMGTLIADRYADSDFSTERFIRIERGDNLISAAGDGGVSRLKVEAQIEYATV